MSDLLEQQLHTLHRQNQPGAVFADQLEQQLRVEYNQMRQNAKIKPFKMSSFYRHFAVAVASLVMIVILFTTVSPLRSFAQNVIDFFVVGGGFTLPGDELAYTDVVAVDSISEAEVIAGFEALEWVEVGFNILHISAAEGLITITYEHEDDRGVLLIVSKWRTDTRPEQRPVSPDAEILFTTINGVEAQFVAGYWIEYAGSNEVTWESEHYRQLRWQVDGFSYSMLVSITFAETLEDVVAFAESLR